MITIQKFTSRKFILALATILVMVFGDLGLTQEIAIAGLAGIYVLAQAFIDKTFPSLSDVPFMTDAEEQSLREKILGEIEDVLSGDSVAGDTAKQLAERVRSTLLKRVAR